MGSETTTPTSAKVAGGVLGLLPRRRGGGFRAGEILDVYEVLCPSDIGADADASQGYQMTPVQAIPGRVCIQRTRERESWWLCAKRLFYLSSILSKFSGQLSGWGRADLLSKWWAE